MLNQSEYYDHRLQKKTVLKSSFLSFIHKRFYFSKIIKYQKEVFNTFAMSHERIRREI
jgi:hypothetical protein